MAMARYLIDQQAAPDGIGFMSHFTSGSLTAIDELKQIFDDFSQLGLPLQLTELDVDTGFDEQLQADYLRDVLILSFSHPAVEAVNLWGFWEGRHWRPNAALWRRNWQIKPAGHVWLDWVHKRWRTLASGYSNPTGTFEVKGFLGEYDITVVHNGKQKTETCRLTKESSTITVILD
jgi:endo-1,4-beta-xylanase